MELITGVSKKQRTRMWESIKEVD
uniref:Uncharacterized protein n=1 Tax=Arundo donax TaxID=35708 RepID=A0A0A9C8Z2_ARUDO